MVFEKRGKGGRRKNNAVGAGKRAEVGRRSVVECSIAFGQKGLRENRNKLKDARKGE